MRLAAACTLHVTHLDPPIAPANARAMDSVGNVPASPTKP